MNIKITSIADSGILAKERIVMKVVSHGDVGSYAMFDAECVGNSVTTNIHSVFWFPDKKVSQGDLVVLYSKDGKPSSKKLSSGRTTHFFYWGRNRILWNTSDRVPVLAEIDEWEAFFK